MDKNSMLYWYPKVKDLAIPQPETIVIEVNPGDAFKILDGTGEYPEMPKFQDAIRKLGTPIFIRTDQMSGKHDWERTCFFNAKYRLRVHIYGLVDSTLGCDVMGRPVNAFCFRKYIHMDSKYRAFWGKMPVNPERRYFIENGQVLCHHPYWIEESIIRPSKKNWKELSKEMNLESQDEIKLLTEYAKSISIDGFWSVDFCRAKNKVWYLIDMAIGENSWHPKDCPNNRTKEIDYMKQMMGKTERS